MKKIKDIIGDDVELFQIEYRIHASRRMFQRNISSEDVERVISQGEVIEDYPDDSPLPSILLNGKSTTNNPLHVVVAINIDEKFLIIITVYEPNPVKWMNNYARRLK